MMCSSVDMPEKVHQNFYADSNSRAHTLHFHIQYGLGALLLLLDGLLFLAHNDTLFG